MASDMYDEKGKRKPLAGMPVKPGDYLNNASSEERKNMPLARGVLDYFPDALAAVAEHSQAGNDKHNPGEPLHWSRPKSTDHADCIIRHLAARGTRDKDGTRHSAGLAWRALALLQLEIEAEVAAKAERTVGKHPVLGARYGQLDDVPPSLDDPLRRVPGRSPQGGNY